MELPLRHRLIVYRLSLSFVSARLPSPLVSRLPSLVTPARLSTAEAAIHEPQEEGGAPPLVAWEWWRNGIFGKLFLLHQWGLLLSA